MSKYHTDCNDSMKSITNIFPIEVDLPVAMLNNLRLNDYDDDENEDDSIILKDEEQQQYDERQNQENLIDISSSRDDDLLGLK
jgi:hypothetical protein